MMTCAQVRGSRLITVKDSRRAVAASHGLSHHERDLLTESFDHMRQRGPGLFVSLEAGKSPDAERIVRAMTRRVRSDLAQRQRRAGMRRVRMTTVFEARDRKGREKFGAHIVAVMPDATARDRAIEALNGSSAYAGMATGFCESGRPVFAERVTDWAGLTTYLLKEATPQAQYRKGFRRVGGSIPLGAGVTEGSGVDFTVIQAKLAIDMAVRLLEKQQLPAREAGPNPAFLTKANAKNYEWTTMFAPKGFAATYSVQAK
jgi:hypothetical protein